MMRPMQKHIDNGIKIVKAFYNSNKSDLKFYQMLTGSLNFCAFYTFFGRHQLKFLHRFHSYFKSGYRIIPPSLKIFLNLWIQNSMYKEINIPTNQVDVELFTDASNQGWGGALIEAKNSLPINGTWSRKESSLHINIKELLACIFSIKHFKIDWGIKLF